MKELVALATEHGILTPYTSFLADETSDVRDVAANRRRALSESESLDETSGRYRLFAARRETLAAIGLASARPPQPAPRMARRSRR